MSAIAGIICRDGQTAQVEALASLLPELTSFGPDGVTYWAEGTLALAHFALHTTPEATAECWPLRHPSGLLLLADARLDNRDVLLPALKDLINDAPVITDADLILAAHLRWDDEAPARLVGDYAYLLWDAESHRAQFVRSPFGLKPLFYRIERDRLLFASSLRGVQALSVEQLQLDSVWLAGFLAQQMRWLHEGTAYHGVSKVPAAHSVTIDLVSGACRKRRFWQLAPSDEYEGWSDALWQETLRGAFAAAVASTLRSRGPVSAAVSGGLDSSSIALMAHHLITDHQLAATPLFLHTRRMTGWPGTDESRYRDAVVAQLPAFQAEWVEVPTAWDWPLVERWNCVMSYPVTMTNGYGLHHGLEHAREHGCRVTLAGVGGDLVTGGEDYAYLETLASLPWRERVQEAPYFGRALGGYSRLARLWLRESIPAAIRRERARRWPRLTSEKCAADAAGAGFRRPAAPGTTPLQRLFEEMVYEPVMLFPFEYNGEIAASYGVEYRAPYTDQRLVELCFHLPQRLRIRRGQTRALFKEALRDLLPPLLYHRTSKTRMAEFVAFSVAPDDHARALSLVPDNFFWRQGWINDDVWRQWSAHPTLPQQAMAVHRLAHAQHWVDCRVGTKD